MTRDPDAPEPLVVFQRRHIAEPGKDYHDSTYFTWDQADRNVYLRDLAIEWRQLEREKAQRRKAKEAQLKAAERMRKRKAEEERRDPTPFIYPSTFKTPIPYAIRPQHIFVPGKTGHGKSSQLLRIIMGDIQNGLGVAVLDPKGDLVRDVCALMPEDRVNDCIYLDLDDPIPLDVIGHASNPESMVGDIKQLVLKGDSTLKRAEPILTRLIYSLFSVPDSRFTDIEAFFIDPDRKQEIMDALEKHDPGRFKYWTNNKPTKDEYASLISRMTDFTENKSLKTILGEPHPRLNISRVMDNKRIVLADLSGTGEPREIYGSLLVARFQQAAFARMKRPASQRVPFYLFVDEFEEFQTVSFPKILSVARSLGLCLTVGNQFISQLSPEIRHAVFGNVATFIIFKIGEDFQVFKPVVHPYDCERLGLLKQYQAVIKVGDEAPIFKWTLPPLPIDEIRAANIKRRIKANTLRDFGPRPKRSNSIGDNPSSQADPNMVQFNDGEKTIKTKPRTPR